jgi:L-2-hydroxyglutarate oxidase
LEHDIVIIGAGIVGLSTGYNLKLMSPDLKVLIIEKENEIAKHQTGNNSGVIHSGIYYKPGSLKAENCKGGYVALIDFCEKHDVKHEICGKIIVATDKSEVPLLGDIYERGIENGLSNLKRISSTEIREVEPHCQGLSGLWVPQAGIIDYKEVSQKYLELFLCLEGELVLNTKVLAIEDKGKITNIVTDKEAYTSKWIVNCAGLYSDKVAKMTDSKVDVQILPFRGEYYTLKEEKKHLVKNLIYPVPNPNFPFLGVHFTRMINGGIEAGPNAVLAFAREGYNNSTVNWKELFEILGYSGFQKVAMKYWKDGLYEMYRSYSKEAFTKALQKLVPEIVSSDLEVGNAGVRAQACDSKGNLSDDFLIFEKNRTINICNAPSPAATSSLAIGKTIAELVYKRMN